MSTQFTQTKRASDHTLKLVQTIGPEGSPNQSVFTNYADNADRLRAIEYHNMEWHSPPNSHNETSVFYLSKESSGEQQLTFAEYMAWVGAGNGEDGTFTRDDCRYCQTARSQGPNPRYFFLTGDGRPNSHKYKVVQRFGALGARPLEVYTSMASTVTKVTKMADHVLKCHQPFVGSSTCEHYKIEKDGDHRIHVEDTSQDPKPSVSGFATRDCDLCVAAIAPMK